HGRGKQAGAPRQSSWSSADPLGLAAEDDAALRYARVLGVERARELPAVLARGGRLVVRAAEEMDVSLAIGGEFDAEGPVDGCAGVAAVVAAQRGEPRQG